MSNVWAQNEKDETVHLKFRESDSLFANPGQGWFNTKRFPTTDRYVRRNWVDFEPERGRFDWTLIDNAIAEGRSRGIKVSLRIMTFNPHSTSYYCSPKWLFDEGCKSYELTIGGTGDMSAGIRIPRIEPEYSDPVFLQRHGEFIKALGQRYDGSPDIDFIDIGSYGDWGEWHTRHPVNAEVRRKIVDMYTQAFTRTQLVFLHGDEEILAYAIGKGVGTRRDGIGSPWDRKDYESSKYNAIPGYSDAWKRAPVVFEWYGGYEWMTKKGWPLDSAVDFMIRNHVTYVHDNLGEIPPDKVQMFNRLTRLAGARFVLNEISFRKRSKAGSALDVVMNWSNTGAGKTYLPYVLRFYIIDRNGETAFTSDSKSAPSDWLPGRFVISETLNLPSSLKSGTYKLCIALVDKSGNRPPFRLANDLPVTNGVYIIDQIVIK